MSHSHNTINSLQQTIKHNEKYNLNKYTIMNKLYRMKFKRNDATCLLREGISLYNIKRSVIFVSSSLHLL